MYLLPAIRLVQKRRRFFKLKKGLRKFLLLFLINTIVTMKYFSINTYLGLCTELLWLGSPTVSLAVLLVLIRSTHVFVIGTLPSVVGALLILHPAR